MLCYMCNLKEVNSLTYLSEYYYWAGTSKQKTPEIPEIWQPSAVLVPESLLLWVIRHFVTLERAALPKLNNDVTLPKGTEIF